MQKPLAKNDRVAVYGSSKMAMTCCNGDIGTVLNVDENTVDVMMPNGPYTFHKRQCFRLKKATPRRRIWVPEASVKDVIAGAANNPLHTEKSTFSAYKIIFSDVEFIEVKKK